MRCTSQLLTPSPASHQYSDFCAHANVSRCSSRWKLNSRARPAPCWGPPFVWPDRRGSDWREMSGNPPSTLRFLGAVKRFVPSIQIWWSFPCSALQQLFVGLSFSSMSTQELRARLTLCSVCFPWFRHKLGAPVWRFSLVTNHRKTCSG